MSPSEDIAYRTLGKGNIAPSRLVERPNKAPMDTTQPTNGQPTCITKVTVVFNKMNLVVFGYPLHLEAIKISQK